jgi:hypothetical protein
MEIRPLLRLSVSIPSMSDMHNWMDCYLRSHWKHQKLQSSRLKNVAMVLICAQPANSALFRSLLGLASGFDGQVASTILVLEQYLAVLELGCENLRRKRTIGMVKIAVHETM